MSTIYCPICGKVISFTGLRPETCQYCFKRIGKDAITEEESSSFNSKAPISESTDVAFNNLFKKASK